MGNAWEVWGFVHGEVDGVFCTGWKQLYGGENEKEAMAIAKEYKQDYPFIKIEWR